MAFRRGLANFQAYARVGLFWLYLDSNFSLDGRFLDLETPLFFGAPFVGVSVVNLEGTPVRGLLGFEEFGYVWHWRLFIAWLKSRLRLLTAPEIGGMREARPCLRELHREIAARFSPRHLLYRDEELIARATDNLAGSLNLARRDRRRLLELAQYAFEWRLYCPEEPPPDMGWKPLDFQPAPATPSPRLYEAASFIEPTASPDCKAFADALGRLSSTLNAGDLLSLLAKPANFVPDRATSKPR
jgi:hypothetical protein